MSWATVKRTLKRLDCSYRRARRTTAKAPRPAALQAAQRALTRLRRLAARGGCDLYFGDESGFSLWPVLPSLWQPRRRTLALPAQTHHQRLNVLGFWKEAAVEGATLLFASTRGALTTEYFVTAVETQLLPHLRRRAVLILDNAKLHRSRLVQERKAAWRAQGLNVLFLPPYCPHINRIEVLWKQVKYRWLEPQAYADFETLCQRVTTILAQCPSKYRLSFV